MSWIESHYQLLERLVRSGAWTQVTAGSILGGFGRRVRALSKRLLEDGLVHIVASDAHDTEVRTPRLSEAFHAIKAQLGQEEAMHLVLTRPAGILQDTNPGTLPMPRRPEPASHRAKSS